MSPPGGRLCFFRGTFLLSVYAYFLLFQYSSFALFSGPSTHWDQETSQSLWKKQLKGDAKVLTLTCGLFRIRIFLALCRPSYLHRLHALAQASTQQVPHPSWRGILHVGFGVSTVASPRPPQGFFSIHGQDQRVLLLEPGLAFLKQIPLSHVCCFPPTPL